MPACVMTNPVLVEVLRGDLVESRASRRGRGVRRRRQGGAGDRRRRRAGVPALGGQGDPGAAAGRKRRGGSLRLRRQGTGAGLRLAFGRAGACRAGGRHAGAGRPGRQRARMRRALAVDPRRDRRAGALAAAAPTALHNNCSGKHSGFLCALPASRHRSSRLCRRRASLPGDGARGDGGGDRRRARRATTAASTAARSRPMRCRSEIWRLGFARMATGKRPVGRSRAKAAKRLFAACMAEPFFVAGTGRADTRADAGRAGPHLRQDRRRRRLLRGRAGTRPRHRAEMRRRRRAAPPKSMVAAVLAKLFADDGAVQAALADLARPAVRTGTGSSRRSGRRALTARRHALIRERVLRLGIMLRSAHAVALDGQVGIAAGAVDGEVAGRRLRPAIADDGAVA